MKSINIAYQILLSNLGFYKGDIDGKHGPKTNEAVKKFQRMNGLRADGIIGPNTKRELDEQLAKDSDRLNDTTSGIRTIKKYDMWPKESTSSLTRFYGQPGKNQVIMDTPWEMVLAWDINHKIYRFSCHEKVADSMYKALEEIGRMYTAKERDQFGFNKFGGCLNVRPIRGGTRLSTHAWGIAIDIDPARNRLKWNSDRAFLARPECKGFHEAFKKVGGYNLGIHKNYDWMHTQFCYR